MKIDGRLKKSNEKIVETYIYYLNFIIKEASSVPFKIRQSSNVTELIVTYDELDYEFRDYSKSDVVRICKNRNFTNDSQLDNLIKELAKNKALQIFKDYQSFLNTNIIDSNTTTTNNTFDKDLFIRNLTKAITINTKYLKTKYNIDIDFEIIYLANKYIHFDCKTLEALDNKIPDFKLSDEQVELMYKENDSNAIETISSEIYSWIMNHLDTTTKLALANQDDLKDMLVTFAQISNAKSVKLCRNQGYLCIKYDNKLSDTFLLISSDPNYLKSLII
ncbi:hypothetical protein ABM135_09255 [Enterococcus cecorum]|uniref:hypothetical protein n=1 Tax=Enterococcus TaxID=1350 RepID=UPI0010C0E2E9|nr:hypothetical protein [Enterococcus faecalis]TKO59336.1 hypothetical protein DVY43_14270 [Enterococcus faecalis]TKO71708.1 hypothetical protein DVY36_14305 [Enterococcus faecalis]TKO99601.1 hypothetical protein DVY35_14455 [Enterococcus faecalis]CAI3486400.1 hypothetical protein CIRMBP1290_01872 [Enterococcus cecorum]